MNADCVEPCVNAHHHSVRTSCSTQPRAWGMMLPYLPLPTATERAGLSD
jgi:hypothetical protein